MKLTYTIEFDLQRATGPNVKKDRASGVVMNELIRQLSEWEFSAPRRGREQDDAELFVKDFTIWPHEDSIPERVALMPRGVVDRTPSTEPGSEPYGKD